MKEIHEIIVVTLPEYRPLFKDFPVKFALPGTRRQDSVYHGLQAVSSHSEWIITHDGVRPFITEKEIRTLIEEGLATGAATLGMPIKPTIKECTLDGIVKKTPDRSLLWEVQTPQILSKNLYMKGFEIAHTHSLTVTECTTFAELQHHPVKMVLGSYFNVKITTPEDLLIAETFLNSVSSCR